MKRSRRPGITIVALLVLLAVVTVGPGGAGGGAATARATTSDAQGKLNATQDRLAQVRARVAAAKARESALSSQVAGFDSSLSSISGRLAAINGEIQKVSARLAATHDKLARLRDELVIKKQQLIAARAELALEQEQFAARMATVYKRGQVTSLDVLVGSTDWNDLVTRLSFVRDITRFENDLVAQLAAARARVAEQKAALAADELAAAKLADELQAQTERLATLKTAAEQQYAALSSARAAKAGLLAQAATTRAAYEAQERALQAESARLATVIAGAGGGSAHGTGSLVWPVSGPVTSPFGWRIHPIFHTRMFHTGIDIGAASGTAIVAADSGTVIIAAPEGGYGNVIVIDHGGGLSTLYAHMSGYAVTGGAVKRGQVIGYVGMTGFATGPHLHFEVRKGGQPVDPMGYLP